MPEAVSDTTGTPAEREPWREVPGAAGPASAVFSMWEAAGVERHIADLAGAAALLSHVAVSPNAVGEDELLHLAKVTSLAAAVVREAFERADNILRSVRHAERADAAEAEDGPAVPPLPEPSWLPAARAEGARLASQGLRRELGFTAGDVDLIRWLARRVAEAEGTEAGARLLALAGIAAEDAPA